MILLSAMTGLAMFLVGEDATKDYRSEWTDLARLFDNRVKQLAEPAGEPSFNSFRRRKREGKWVPQAIRRFTNSQEAAAISQWVIDLRAIATGESIDHNRTRGLMVLYVELRDFMHKEARRRSS